ncbi:MAG: serine/threonine-protein kinase [Kofleriaceae bacterium]
MPCLDEATVLAFLAGSEPDREQVETHLADCQRCRTLVRLALPSRESREHRDLGLAATLVDPASLAATEPTLGAGDRVGRFEIRSLLGQGGMGVVYAAWDPQLDRRVALKVMRGARKAGAQLLREGRAVARLTHPNVVTVYDIDDSAGRWFVAMELVAGETLDIWLRSQPRSVDEIVAMFVAAGRGLAAAHAVGLVHRDFKPSNVLVGEDGRPRVSDFGLAIMDGDLGGVGATSGTPAYMAPEQLDGGQVDARSDQFSFAVALFEALEGQRPFTGTTARSIRVAMASRPPAARHPRSPGVARALRRALATSPHDRFPDLPALLDELGRRRKITAGWLVAAVAISCSIAIGAILSSRSDAPRACQDLDRGLQGIWDTPRRLAVQARLSGLDPTSARTVAAGLDRYAASWSAARVDACEAAQVRREQTASQQALRTVCLDERLTELRAVSDLLTVADGTTAINAHAMLAALTPIDACADLATLSERLQPIGTAQIANVRALRGQLARVAAAELAGAYVPASNLLHNLRDSITHVGYRPLEAAAALLAGRLADWLGQFRDAEVELRSAVLLAEAGRDSRTVARAWTELAKLRGRRVGDRLGANEALAHAAATVERLGNDPDAKADLAYARAIVLRESGDHRGARDAYDEAIRLLASSRLDRRVLRSIVQLDRTSVTADVGAATELTSRELLAQLASLLGTGHPDYGSGLVTVGSLDIIRGDPTLAETRLAEADRIFRATLPADNRKFGPLRELQASLAFARGDHELARSRLAEARAIYERQLGDGATLVAGVHRAAAILAMHAGDQRTATRELADAEQRYEQNTGKDSMQSVITRMVRSWLALGDGRVEDAMVAAQQSLGEARRTFGAESSMTATATHALAVMTNANGDAAAAVPLYQQVIAITERVGGAHHNVLALYRSELGEILLGLARFAEAIAALEASVAVDAHHDHLDSVQGRATRAMLATACREAGDLRRSVDVLSALVDEMAADPTLADDPELHRARMRLGIDLVASGGDRARARALVVGAHVALRKLDPKAAITARRWLATHR